MTEYILTATVPLPPAMPPSTVWGCVLERLLTTAERKQTVKDAMAAYMQQIEDASNDLRRHIYTGEPLSPAGHVAAHLLGGHPWPESS